MLSNMLGVRPIHPPFCSLSLSLSVDPNMYTCIYSENTKLLLQQTVKLPEFSMISFQMERRRIRDVNNAVVTHLCIG